MKKPGEITIIVSEFLPPYTMLVSKELYESIKNDPSFLTVKRKEEPREFDQKRDTSA